MQQLIAWLDANKTWLFSGVGVALLLWLLKRFLGRKVASGPTLSQSGGAQSVYVQDIEKSYVTVQTGITVADAKQIAVDVVRGELSALTSEAHDTFARRTHEFADLLIERIVATGAGSLSAFKQPDMQLTVRQAQMQYGKTGDDDLRDTLLNIIEKVASNNTKDILKLVLQESIEILPKLTSEQINVLAVVFYFKHTKKPFANSSTIFSSLNKLGSVLGTSLPRSRASFQHLAFAGCGTVSMGGLKIEKILAQTYPGVFAKGFQDSDKNFEKLSDRAKALFTMKCINDINKLQIAATTDEMLERRTRQLALDDQSIAAVKKLFSHVMDHAGIRDLIGRLAPQCMPIVEFWDETPAGRLDLTSVGIAIGSGRVEKALGEKFDLSIWIN